MASKNQLLGSRVKVIKEEVVENITTDGWPKRLYHIDHPNGKVFQTLAEQEEQFKLGWVESPADLKKEKEITFDSISDKSSKIDLSEKKNKKGK